MVVRLGGGVGWAAVLPAVPWGARLFEVDVGEAAEQARAQPGLKTGDEPASQPHTQRDSLDGVGCEYVNRSAGRIGVRRGARARVGSSPVSRAVEWGLGSWGVLTGVRQHLADPHAAPSPVCRTSHVGGKGPRVER